MSMDFSVRSYKKELLDRDDIPFADIKQNMKELDFINAKLGGHKITLQGVKTVMRAVKAKEGTGKVSILEIGCGGGDNLRVIKNYFERRHVDVQLSGVDINPHCIEFARSRKENEGIAFIHSDYKLVNPFPKPDIIFNSLFCHHFDDQQMMDILVWMKEHSNVGFFINDLHRHPLAYYSIKWLTALFSKSYLVKNDAPLSVLRGFRRRELKTFCEAAVADNIQSLRGGHGGSIIAQLKWKWAFRWLLISFNE